MDTDRKIKELLKSKIQGHKMLVEEDLWKQVESAIPKGRSSFFFNNVKKWAFVIPLFFVVGVVGFISLKGDDTAIDQIQGEKENLQSNDQRGISDLESTEQKSASFVEPDEKRSQEDLVESSSKEQVSPLDLVQSLKEVQTLATVESEQVVDDQVEPGEFLSQAKNPDFQRIKKLDPLPYEFQNMIFGDEPPGLETKDKSLTVDEDEPKKQMEFRFSGQLSLNYLNIRPNVNDQLFLQNVATDLSLSPKHLGLSIRLQGLMPLKSKLWLKNEVYTSIRQHNIDFEYIEEAANPELIAFDRFTKTFSPVLVGVSTGLEYELNTTRERKLRADFGISIEGVITGAVNNEALLGYPKAIWSLNLGLSVLPKKEKSWIVRPFTFFSLNQKYSNAPIHMTPYGFGIEFSK